jgi:hypothetical protein
MDRPWKKGGHAQLYTFTFPDQTPVNEDFQISCRHELRILLDSENLSVSPVSRDDIVDGDAVYKLACELVPTGIRVDVAARVVLAPSEWNFDSHVPLLAVFLMNYSGEYEPLTRELADGIRANLEGRVQEQWKLEVAKAGYLVSRPYPRSLLPTLIKEYNR